MRKVAEIATVTAGRLGSIFGGIGAGMLIEGAVRAADRIRMVSDEFRISYETMQRWDIAAKRTNQSAEDIGNAFNKLKKARDIAIGTGALGGFAAFNIPMAALKDAAITTEQILERMVSVTANGITDAQDVAGMELMGKSGAKILSAFRELHELGPVTLIGNEEIDKMHQLQEGFEDLKRTSSSFVGKLFIGATKGAPAIVQTAKNLWNYAFGHGNQGDGMAFDIGSGAGTGGLKADGTPAKLLGPVTEGMSNAQIKEMKQVQLELAEKILQNSLKTMTAEEKRAVLNKQIADHKKAASAAFEDANWLAGERELLEAERVKGELLAVKDDPIASQHARTLRGSLTANQQHGAYVGDVQVSMIDVAKKSERHLAEIKAELKNKGAGHGPASMGRVKF